MDEKKESKNDLKELGSTTVDAKIVSIKEKIENDIPNFEKYGIHWITEKTYIYDRLIEPKLEEYINVHDGSKIFLWTVFEESGDGYAIVYSDDFEEFGLAFNLDKGKGKGFLGIYGSFGETLSSM